MERSQHKNTKNGTEQKVDVTIEKNKRDWNNLAKGLFKNGTERFKKHAQP